MKRKYTRTQYSAALCRAARGLLNWTQQDLSARTGISISSLADFERGARWPQLRTLQAIETAFAQAGVEFTLEAERLLVFIKLSVLDGNAPLAQTV